MNYLVISNIFVFISVLSYGHGANILAHFPVPSISHQVVFRPLTQELAKRGHQITVLTPDPVFKNKKQPENFTEIDLHDASYEVWREEFVDKVSTDSYDSIDLIETAFITIANLFEAQWKRKDVQDAVKGQKFDLILVEACARPTMVYSHHYKVPVIQVSSFGGMGQNFAAVGASMHPILYPEITRHRIHDLSLLEKIQGFYEDLRFKYVQWKTISHEDKILRRNFGVDTPSVAELANRVDLLLLNVHPIWDNNRPVPPNVVYMGGMHQKPVKDLPKDLKSYLDGSVNGVIYMSFGTNVNTTNLPQKKIDIFNKVFKKLPYDILWKWNDDSLQGKPENVKISKWLPQSDLLRHPKVKLFITQGGLQSTDEAITAGVPLLVFPMLGDQWYNAEYYVKLKIGLQMSFEGLVAEKLEENIKTLIQDQSFKANIRRVSQIMKDQPQPPLERAIWWVEYVLRHGGAKHLRAPSAGISWSEYLMIDVMAVLIMGCTLLVFFVWNLFKFVSVSTENKIKRS